MSRWRAKAAALLITCALAAGCKPREGSSCKGTESFCADPATALACHGGKLVKVSCKGPLGCSRYEDHANCDEAVANEGDACMGESDDEYACSPDKTRALVCKGGTFARHLECRGKGGCSVDGRTLACDTSIARANDPCKAQGALACSDDGKEVLGCELGRFGQRRFCRGPGGCTLRGDTPDCDDSIALDGDPCTTNGYIACAVDGKRELVCENGRFSMSRACRRSGCTVRKGVRRTIACD